MSDKELISRGAELVTGDLILHRKVVGQYRNGQFMLTPEGVNELENIVDAVVKEAASPRKPRAKKADAVETQDEPVDATDSIMGDLQDILAD
ncbi:MAG TPA: hypothetical protein PLE48_13385 [Thiobacillus sp.]|uniref:hypothetical protein n=1 Tax=Acidovorax sp. TaxID=1872122 RepID=UPI0026158C78|nr:hypothetical protein [Acidovorax sp.]HQT19131.1 hypothetical protein [Acidovorax defluvii]HQT71399.1 hypothetical protein [Thiobacillus sp.]